MLLGRSSHWEGAISLKARWPYRVVLQSLGPGTSRHDSLAGRRERDGVSCMAELVQRDRGAGFHGQNDKWMCGWMDRRVDRWMDERMDGLMDGWTDGWMV